MANNRQSQSESEKRGSAMLLLPLFGAAFSLPPIMNLFNHQMLVFGMPLEFLYLIGVWTLMVVIAFFITRKPKKRVSLHNENATKTSNDLLSHSSAQEGNEGRS